MPTRFSDETKKKFWDMVSNRGYSVAEASRTLGVGISTAHAWKSAFEKGEAANSRNGHHYAQLRAQAEGETVGDPVHYDDLSDDARRALDDHVFFMVRYWGLEPAPWGQRASDRIERALDSEDYEYVLQNVPPGHGKSELLMSVVARLIARDRGIRIGFASATDDLAKTYVRNIATRLTSPTPIGKADAAMCVDFGRFKPEAGSMWRADRFNVELLDRATRSTKEPTVRSMSPQTSFLGDRFDIVVLDDVANQVNSRSAESRETLTNWLDLTVESRLQPGGTLFLNGQRIGGDDIYAHVLKKKRPPQDFDGEEVTASEVELWEPQYEHIKYPAHDVSRCVGKHPRGMKPWPDSCLLDPRLVSWRFLAQRRSEDPATYAVWYQQEDSDASSVLVKEVWLEGGFDSENREHVPGCYDFDRDLGEMGEGYERFLVEGTSVVSVDPSPRNWWAIQWWILHRESGQRFLIDLVRKRNMPSNEFLDYVGGRYTGELEHLRQRAAQLGCPIRHVAFEGNAAQSWLLENQATKTWRLHYGVHVLNHKTHANKSDAQYGVPSIGAQYRMGNVRLPAKTPLARKRVRQLTDELARWPDGATDDQVMANWMMEYNFSQFAPQPTQPVRLSRPTWLRDGMGGVLSGDLGSDTVSNIHLGLGAR